MISDKIRADFLLLIVAAIWGLSLVAQSIGLDYLGPFGFNAGRFLLGALCLLPLVAFIVRPSSYPSFKMIKGSLAAGFFLFMGAGLQQSGLQYTTAANAGFVTSMYIVLVPIFGLAFAHKTSVNTWSGAALAIIGLYFLSVRDNLEINIGDALMLLSACFWAGHLLLIARLSRELNNLMLAFLQFLFCGLAFSLIAFVSEAGSFKIDNIVSAWKPLIFSGVLTVGVGYTLQVIGQKYAPASHAAIIMSMEAVFAAIGGWLWLEEHLNSRELIGCLIMLTGVIISQINFTPRPTKSLQIEG